MAIIFSLVTYDVVRLLGELRTEDTALREAVRQRTGHLASIRSSFLLTHTYLGDYLLDSDPRNSEKDLLKIQEAWARTRSDLAAYRPSTRDEAELVKRLQTLLDQHWQDLDRSLRSPSARSKAFYNDRILPLRVTVDEITAQLETLDAKQVAAAEVQIQDEFARLNERLSRILRFALAAGLVVALACMLYILRIEAQNNRRYHEIIEARQALEQLSARLVDMQESERRSISRELHDQVGQTLNALLMDAANLAGRIPSSDAASRRYLDNIRKFADSSVNAIRDIALLLRPSMLDDLGLIPALEWQAREVSRRTGIKVTVSAAAVPDSLPDEVRTCVYRVVQEALHNVSRHSAAKVCTVTVRTDNGSLYLEVEDDGRGFDPQKTRGLGILGMEERVKQLGGDFELRSQEGKGALLRVALPVPVLEAPAIR